MATERTATRHRPRRPSPTEVPHADRRAPRHHRRAASRRLALADRQGRAALEPARPPRHRRRGAADRHRLRGDGAAVDRERDPGRPRHRLPRRARPGQDADGAAARRPARRGDPDRPRRRAQRRPVRPRQPGRHGDRRARRRRHPDRLAAARPALRREARDARHHDRRPHRRGRPDQGRRGPLPLGRADAPLRPDPARQPRDRGDQRAARPRRADPGRPAQRARGARRPDPRVHRPPAARPVRRRVGQPGGLHLARPDHHAAQGPPGVADPDPLPADARARDGDRPPGEAPLRRRRGCRRSSSCRRSWRRPSPS